MQNTQNIIDTDKNSSPENIPPINYNFNLFFYNLNKAEENIERLMRDFWDTNDHDIQGQKNEISGAINMMKILNVIDQTIYNILHLVYIEGFSLEFALAQHPPK